MGVVCDLCLNLVPAIGITTPERINWQLFELSTTDKGWTLHHHTAGHPDRVKHQNSQHGRWQLLGGYGLAGAVSVTVECV